MVNASVEDVADESAGLAPVSVVVADERTSALSFETEFDSLVALGYALTQIQQPACSGLLFFKMVPSGISSPLSEKSNFTFIANGSPPSVQPICHFPGCHQLIVVIDQI